MVGGGGPQRVSDRVPPDQITRRKSMGVLAAPNLDQGAIIRLTHRKRKQTESVSGQHCITGGKVIEPDPSVANPDHTWWYVVSDVGFCPELYLSRRHILYQSAKRLTRKGCVAL